MERIGLVGLLKWEAAGGDVRLCDGGSILFAGEQYRSRDDRFGSLQGFEPISEGVGDQAPAGAITFLVPDTTPAAMLIDKAHQNSRLRLWIAEINLDTGLPSAAEQEIDAIVDVPRLMLAQGKRALALDFVTRGQRLLLRAEGNTLSPSAHRRIYPNEAGLDAATGVTTTFAWGAQSVRGVR
jgi:hypothetical protein